MGNPNIILLQEEIQCQFHFCVQMHKKLIQCQEHNIVHYIFIRRKKSSVDSYEGHINGTETIYSQSRGEPWKWNRRKVKVLESLFLKIRMTKLIVLKAKLRKQIFKKKEANAAKRKTQDNIATKGRDV